MIDWLHERAWPRGWIGADLADLAAGRFQGFGGEQNHRGGGLRKAASLVKLLALSPTHRLHREQVMDALWPDLGTGRASNNLRQALHAARRTLEPGRSANSRYLSLREKQLTLCPGERLWVDIEAFEEAAATARRSRDPSAFRLAVELYAGELLPGDRYEEWTEGRREELRRLYLGLLLELAGLYEEGGEHDAGVEALLRAAAEDPALEEAHAGLMRLYALSGRRTRALAQYRRLRKVLSEKLEMEPDASTRRLYDEIAAGRFPSGEPTALAAKKQQVEGKHNLPAPRSSFVGREQELIEVKRTLVMTRLLTLTGVGGSGKTRLAVEVARDLVGAYPDGVWLLELAPLTEPDLIPQAVAETLGVRESPGQPLIDTFVETLRPKNMVLVLDNCEHLVEAAARLVDVLLSACPRLRILATSREPLDVEGEVIWRVPPLSVPDPQHALTVQELQSSESARLFLERTVQRDRAFILTEQNAQMVSGISRKLEGIPLAIELAAARVGTLSLEQIAQKLEESLELLTGGGRIAMPRQRTLSGTLDWSYDLLLKSEQRVFRRLSVFAGGWTLQASEAVASSEGVDEAEVLDLLSGLVGKSLVVAEPTAEDGVRYRMLEPVRQYALHKLEESGEVEAVKHSHAEHFLALAEGAEPRLWGSEESAWLQRLEAELDNLRTAFSWALEREEPELGLRLAGALRWFWSERGYNGEGLEWSERVLVKDRGRASEMARAKVLDAAGWLAVDLGDLNRAEAIAREGIRLSEETGVRGGLAASFFDMLGMMASMRGDYARAVKLLEEGLVLNREAGDNRGLTFSLFNLGDVASDRGEHERAMELYEEAGALCRVSGDMRSLPKYSYRLGYECLIQGDYERATQLFQEAVDMCREQGQKGGLDDALDKLGWVELARGNHERAKALFKESLVLCVELDDKWIAPENIEGLACIAGARAETERAARLFGSAEALREAVGYQHMPEEDALRTPYLAMARSQLDEASWEEAWAEGRAMSMEQAIDYALSDEKHTSPISPVPERSPAGEQSGLTSREREVANLVARGLTNRQIAGELSLSEHTVITHVRNILKKLNLHSRTQLTLWITERHP